jgi:cystathionine gamma-lyase
MLSLLRSGDHVVCSDDIYGGANRLMNESVARNGIKVDFTDLMDVSNLKSALKPNTKMVFLESPANPTLKVFDIALIAKTAHEFSKDILVCVDNTVLTAFYQRPLELGADLVHYSLTKYANGAADVIMGAVVTNDDKMNEKLTFFQNAFGTVPSPFDCYMVDRGLKTLHIRMPAFMKNSLEVARFLESHPKIQSVNHPALKSHPQHALAKRQSRGHSSLMSFTIKEGCGSAIKFIGQLEIIQNAGSFGGPESLAELPAFFTHMMVPLEQRKKLGITDNFVRLSVGLESAKDLIKDLSQALEKC